MLEIRHLRSLVAIAESGKLVAAAERVNLSQSALSHQIKDMEAHYDASLFERTRHGLRFTAAGERVLELGRAVLAAISATEPALPRLKIATPADLPTFLDSHTS